MESYLALSAALFTIGLLGALIKRNLIVILMCVEIMLNAVNISLVAFSNFAVAETAHTGQVFTLFVITVAAAEVAIGLALVIAIFRNRETVDIRDIDLLKW